MLAISRRPGWRALEWCARQLPDVGLARLEVGELATVGVLEVPKDSPAFLSERYTARWM